MKKMPKLEDKTFLPRRGIGKSERIMGKPRGGKGPKQFQVKEKVTSDRVPCLNHSSRDSQIRVL